MKAKREKPEGLDSFEELYMSWYLEELKQAGFVDSYQYTPKTFSLSEQVQYTQVEELITKTKQSERTFMQGHSYTPDYLIKWSTRAYNVFAKTINATVKKKHEKVFFWSNFTDTGYTLSLYTYIDVKPVFDMQNMTRQFIINQKWLYDKHGIYCQKVIPEHLFKKTFTPERYLKTNKSGRDRKLKFEPVTLNEFLIGVSK